MKPTRLLATSIAALLAVHAARAATFNWLGATDGNWATGTNWVEGAPASAADTALVFDNAAQPTTSNNLAGLTLNSLTLGPNSGVRTLNGNALTFAGTAPALALQNTAGTGNTTVNTPIVMNQTLTVTGGVDFSHQLLFSSTAVFSGTGGLTWAGGLGSTAANNTYQGPTLVNGGILGAAHANSFGSSPSVTVAAGASVQMATNGTFTINKSLSLAGSGFAGTPGALHSSGTGTSQWQGAITLAANATVGTGASSTLGLFGTLDLAGRTLDLFAQTGRTLQFFSVTSGAGEIVLTGPGTVGFFSAATNTFTGPVKVNAGTLAVESDARLGAAANPVVLNGGGVIGQGTVVLPATRGFVLDPAGGRLSNTNSLTVAGPISGAGPLTIGGGGGTAILTGPNTFVGSVLVQTGSLQISGDAALGDAANVVTVSGGNLHLQNGANLPATRAIAVPIASVISVLGTGSTATLGATVSGVGKVTLGSSAGNLTVLGANTHTGGTALSGVVTFDADARFGAVSGAVELPNSATLRAGASFALDPARTFNLTAAAGAPGVFDTAGSDLAIPGGLRVVAAARGWQKTGAGRLDLGPLTSVSGGTITTTTLTAGTLRTTAAQALGTSAAVNIAAGATFDLNGTAQQVASVAGLGATTLGGGALTLNTGTLTALSGPGSVVVRTGAVNFDATTGAVAITAQEAGTINVRTVAGLTGAGGSYTLNNGALSFVNAPTPFLVPADRSLVLGAGGGTINATNKEVTFDAPISGSGPLTLSGTVLLGQAANPFAGNIIVGTGSTTALGIVADGSFGAAGNTVGVNGATLRALAPLTLPATRSLIVRTTAGLRFDTNGFAASVDGAIGQLVANAPFIKEGAGTLTLNGANTYTGLTGASGGTLVIAGSVAGNADVGGSGTLHVAGSVAGNLLIGNNGSATITGSVGGTVQVNTNATLRGTGTMGAVTTFTGILAPGTSAGTLHTGALTLNAGTLQIEVESPTLADQIDVTGAVTLGSSIQLALTLGYAPVGADTFTIIANDGADLHLGTGLFALGANTLTEGETFTTAGADWTISYVGGTGNDVTLTVVPEPGAAAVLLAGAGLLFGLRRGRGEGRAGARAQLGCSVRSASGLARSARCSVRSMSGLAGEGAQPECAHRAHATGLGAKMGRPASGSTGRDGEKVAFFDQPAADSGGRRAVTLDSATPKALPNLETRFREFPEVRPKLETRVREFPEVRPNLETRIREFPEARPNLETRFREFPEARPKLETRVREFPEARPNLGTRFREFPAPFALT